jgi:hypothetical protein
VLMQRRARHSQSVTGTQTEEIILAADTSLCGCVWIESLCERKMPFFSALMKERCHNFGETRPEKRGQLLCPNSFTSYYIDGEERLHHRLVLLQQWEDRDHRHSFGDACYPSHYLMLAALEWRRGCLLLPLPSIDWTYAPRDVLF